MAGDWIKMETSTPDKPEVLAISAQMGWDDPDYAVGKLFRVWRWFDQHTTDGNAKGVTRALLDRISGVSGFAESMEKVGWLIVTDDGIQLPRFDKHCGDSAKKRSQTASRVAKHRAKTGAQSQSADGDGNGNTDSVTSALAREEKRREEKNKKKEKASMSGKPDGAVLEIVDHLNVKTGKAFTAVESTASLIKARLKDFPLEVVKAVIDAKVAQWKGDAKMDEFLRPVTLFNATKFANYAGELAKRGSPDWWTAKGFGSKAEALSAGVLETA